MEYYTWKQALKNNLKAESSVSHKQTCAESGRSPFHKEQKQFCHKSICLLNLDATSYNAPQTQTPKRTMPQSPLEEVETRRSHSNNQQKKSHFQFRAA